VDVEPPAAVAAAAAAASATAAAAAARRAAAAAAPPPGGGAPDALAELAEAKAKAQRVHPRLVALSAPVSARALALLCAEGLLGGVLSLLQPYEYGRGAAVAQAAAAAAGARRVCHPLPDATRQHMAAALPAAAGAVARLALWAGPDRGVLITATDSLDMAAPTVAAAVMHWHWGFTLEEAAAAAPSADLAVLHAAAADMLAAQQPASSGDAPELYHVPFTWRGRASRVALVGDPSGGWDADGVAMAPVAAAAGAPAAAAGARDAKKLVDEPEWRVELLLPRGSYAFKFVADGAKWLVGPAHASAADRHGNVNNGVEAGARGSGHVPASAVEAAAWAKSEHRLALVRGAAASVAKALDDISLLSAAQLESPGAARTAAIAADAAAVAAAAARAGTPPAAPQILR
jgi:hypothetical protein